MNKNKYAIIIFFILLIFLNLHNVHAGLNLSYNIDRGLIERKYNLNSDKIKLYIPEFHVKGIYVTGWAAGSEKMNGLIELAERTVINAMVIDIKDQDGHLTYISDIPLAKEIGANIPKVKNLSALIQRLHSRGIYTIARIAVFKDSLLAQHRRDLALKLYNSENNEISRSNSWVDPANKEVWDYNLMLAKEAIAMGFDEIQFDYIRYPALGNSSTNVLTPEDKPKSYVINGFAKYSKDNLVKEDIPISVDVYGLTTTIKGDMGIGQKFTDLSNIIGIISPMVYPSHYTEGVYGIDIPELEPDRVIYRSLSDARQKINNNEKVVIRPWLQDFSLKYKYTDKEILKQIKAAESLGIKEWLLWNPSSRYTEEAIKDHHF